MKQRVPLIAAVSLALIFAFVAWRLWGRGVMPPVIPENNAPAEIAERPAPDEADDNPPLEEPAPDVVYAPSRHEVPEAEIPPPQPPELHQPDYGPGLWRGGAIVVFDLFQANGEPLPSRGAVGADLYRRVGDHWLRDEARSLTSADRLDFIEPDPEDRPIRRLVTAGLGFPEGRILGLEPGEYEIEVRTTDFGSLRHRFQVFRGERRVEPLRLPHHETTVVFRFRHDRGGPVSHIGELPHVAVNDSPLPPPDRIDARPFALDPPPGEADDIPVSRGFGGLGGYSRQRQDRRTPTDGGRVWVRVLAGASNTIRFHLDENIWGQDEYVHTGSFEGGEEVAVTLHTPVDFEERVQERPLNTGVTAGNRPRTAVGMRSGWRPSSYLTVHVDAFSDVMVEFSHDGKTVTATRVPGEAHRFNTSGAPEPTTIWVRFTDSMLLATDWEPIQIEDGEFSTTITRSFHAPRVDFDLTGLSPTLRAFSHTLHVGLYGKDPVPRENGLSDEDEVLSQKEFLLLPFTEPRDGLPLRLHLEIPVTGDWTPTVALGRRIEELRAIDEPLYLRLQLTGAARVASSWNSANTYTPLPGGRRTSEPLMFMDTPVHFADNGEEALQKLLAGELPLGLMRKPLALRAVGSLGEGLPFVAGSVVPWEDEPLAVAARAAGLILREQGKDPEAISEFLRSQAVDADQYRRMLARAESEPEVLDDLLDDALLEQLRDPAARLWFARNGNWYDASRRVYSDEQGYIVSEGARLEPGRYYVLYLWGASRDPLRPDRRIVFQAGNGVTDLGLIQIR